MIRLTPREKLLIIAVGICAVGWVVFTFAVKPALGRIETLSRVIPEKQQELRRLRARSDEYVFLRDSLDNLRTTVASQEKGFELLPFLESLTEQCGLSKKVATMKQQGAQLESSYYETIVEIKLENLTINQLVEFLWKVESSNVLAKTKSLYIKKSPTNTDLLDSVVEIHNAKLTSD